ncbi:hypothetical protein CFC21_060459 [Triticum aestivum]|uniref:Uncharacterized protein n=2 Tax=Triticum aestivum TaxID=4565 RepID=A0A3B6JFJ9_WHEAT|nr:uncharacterized protein LOC123095891 [Triticum aestivum]KAF7052348.1 hypothetical protein CFC21_060459 [Triticum aestivum]
MASGSTSSGSGRGPSGGSGPLGRGLISCLHGSSCRAEDAPDQDLPLAIDKLIVGFYEEAFSRLPCDAMPDLLRLLATDGGGSCLGLLDPVSNIILNTLALLPKDAAPAPAAAASTSPSPPATRRSKRRALNTTRRSIPGLGGLRQLVSRSYHSLLAFLMAYFGCLKKEQAISYLYRADANLLLAVMLIQHDLYAGEALDPESDRTQAALESAATIAGHPSPTTLAHLMSIRLQDGNFALLKKLFSADAQGIPLTVEDVRATHRILHMMMSPVCTASIIHTKRGLVVNVRHILEARCSETISFSTTADARIATTTLVWGGNPISSLQSGLLPDKLQDCLGIAIEDGRKHNLKTPCGVGDACDYLQSLKMYLHGMIHNLYIKVLKLLPTPSGTLMRSILKAGHCYGCMDPVSNIIVNSIWYNCRGCNLPISERREMVEYNDVLDPLSLLRTQVHSVKGLMELAAFADPQFSLPAFALEFLCSTKCDIANMLPSSTESSEKNPFHESAKAAGHTWALGLGELHQQLLLMPDTRSELLSFITEAQTSGTVLRVDEMEIRISLMWDRNRSGAHTVQAPELCAGALRAVSSERSDYEDRRSLFRSKIEQLLKEYTTQQLLGSEYKLDIILGVEEINKGNLPCAVIRYHVNFTATCNLGLQRTLFYAEFSLSSREQEPEFCCPLPYANAGRCYYGVHSARKIVYPDDAKYIPDDITFRGTRSVDGMLGMDLVYFSPKFDVEIAENLNMLHSEEEEKKKKKKKRTRRGMCRPN